MDNPVRLSAPEKQTLKHLAEGQNDPCELDWLALHRLKRLGLAEAQSTGRGVRITKEGLHALKGSEAKS
jgi:hypothetical protein